MENWQKALIASGGAVASYLFGGWTGLLEGLLVLTILDWISGFAAAAREGKLSSRIGAWGAARKVGVFGVVAAAHIIDRILGDAHLVRDASIIWYSGNELVSFGENLGRIGVKLPPIITRALAVLRSKSDPKM